MGIRCDVWYTLGQSNLEENPLRHIHSHCTDTHVDGHKQRTCFKTTNRVLIWSISMCYLSVMCIYMFVRCTCVRVSVFVDAHPQIAVPYIYIYCVCVCTKVESTTLTWIHLSREMTNLHQHKTERFAISPCYLNMMKEGEKRSAYGKWTERRTEQKTVTASTRPTQHSKRWIDGTVL